jgi:hypothetical protein
MPADQGEQGMRRPRLSRPLAGLAAAACALVPLLGAASADAQQSTIPDVCPGGEMRGPEGECVPGTGMGGSAGMTPPGTTRPGDDESGMMRQGMGGPGMMRHEPMMGRRGHAMKVMFAIADADGDGALSFEEVTVIHKRIFDSVDTDDDGKVTVEEVQAFLRE